MRRLIWAFLTVVPLLHGCSECNDQGCTSGVDVRFAQPLDASLEYAVSIDADGDLTQCDYAEAKGVDTCGPSRVWIQASGGQMTGFLLPEQYPSRITFSFTENGTVVVQDSATPSYEVSQPNGAECGPTCRKAVVQL